MFLFKINVLGTINKDIILTENNTVSIGGVRFNQQDVKKSEVIKQNGQEMNSVFLNDGTHVVYPNQNPENQSSIMQQNGNKVVQVPSHGGNLMYLNQTVEDPTFKETTFNKLDNAQITGTEGKDDYRLKGCKDTSVNISQKDGVEDNVSVRKYKAKGEEKRYSSGVTIAMTENDNASVRQKKE